MYHDVSLLKDHISHYGIDASISILDEDYLVQISTQEWS